MLSASSLPATQALTLYRPIDTLCTFETADHTAAGGGTAPARYAVRQVLDQEHKKLQAQQTADARRARFAAGAPDDRPEAAARLQHRPDNPSGNKENVPPLGDGKLGQQAKAPGVKRDFFGRVLATVPVPRSDSSGARKQTGGSGKARIWVSYHEGFSNAVKKPIGLKTLLDSLS